MDFLRQMLLLGCLINILSDLLAIIRPDVFRLQDKRFDTMCNPFIGLFAAGGNCGLWLRYLYTS
jgi:hypothetical protein